MTTAFFRSLFADPLLVGVYLEMLLVGKVSLETSTHLWALLLPRRQHQLPRYRSLNLRHKHNRHFP